MGFNEQVLSCRKCSELANTRRNVILGEGAIPCDILFLGEAPGKREDDTGKPFQGVAGQILRALMHASGISIIHSHILNVLKCRPPDNRNPTDEELHNCRPFLEHQLKVIRPKAIVAMGRYAQAFVLKQDPSTIQVLKNAGTETTYAGIPAVLTFHPSYISRSTNPQVEAAFKIHLQQAKRLSQGA